MYDRGQTTIEYILILGITISIATALFNSDLFQENFGDAGRIGELIKQKSEFAYRHSLYDRDYLEQNVNYSEGTTHPSYHKGGGSSTTRFFGPKDNYP